MNKNYRNIKKYIIYFLVVFLIIKVSFFVLKISFLPTHSIDYIEKKSKSSLYYRIKLVSNRDYVPVKIDKPKIKVGAITDFQLLAIYSSKDVTVITLVYKGSSKVMGLGDELNGFTLTGATRMKAIFNKNNEEYDLYLTKSKSNLKSSINITEPTRNIVNKKKKGLSQKELQKLGDVRDFGDYKVVDKKLFNYYTENVNDIYKDIGVKGGKEGEGFKVTFVRRDSLIGKLGIKRNDKIQSINGQEISSYNDAFNAYKDIKGAEDISMVVKRGNEEIELNYEIQ